MGDNKKRRKGIMFELKKTGERRNLRKTDLASHATMAPLSHRGKTNWHAREMRLPSMGSSTPAA